MRFYEIRINLKKLIISINHFVKYFFRTNIPITKMPIINRQFILFGIIVHPRIVFNLDEIIAMILRKLRSLYFRDKFFVIIDTFFQLVNKIVHISIKLRIVIGLFGDFYIKSFSILRIV